MNQPSLPWGTNCGSPTGVEGTGPAADICPGINGSTPRSLNAIGTTLLFAANDCEHGRELWAFPVTAPASSLGSMQE